MNNGKSHTGVEWTEENSVITFTLPATDGTTGEGWATRIEQKGIRMSNMGKYRILRNQDFKPTIGIAYTVVVIKAKRFLESYFYNHEYGNVALWKVKSAIEHGWRVAKLPIEVACLMRENFTDDDLKAMSLQEIVCMHTAIIYDRNNKFLFRLGKKHDGGQWLDERHDMGDYGTDFHPEVGLAFVSTAQ